MSAFRAALTIQSQAYPYDVKWADSLESITAEFKGDPKNFFFVDRNILKLYPQAFTGLAPSPRVIVFDATEENKSYEALTPCFAELIKNGFKKDCHLLAIGGGITQDSASFIASNLYRGVRWSLAPTTLLAQADSCIGGKNSINIAGYKNMLGNFYPPRQVLISPDVLKTLSDDDIRSGLGEVVKILFVDGQPMERLTYVPTDPHKIQSDAKLSERIVLDCLKAKKRFIEEDEFDRGIRNFLNYGHTFGHAFESATHYKIPHGIGVTLGMGAAAFFAEKLDYAPAGSSVATRRFLEPFYRPYEQQLKNLSVTDIMAAMKLDKKNTAGGKIGFVLARGPGKLEKVPLDVASQTQPLLTEWLASL